jgi:hypothetical protein
MLVQATTGDPVLQQAQQLTDHAAAMRLTPDWSATRSTRTASMSSGRSSPKTTTLRQAGRFACDIRAVDSTSAARPDTRGEPSTAG